jgi:hypothetical protein
MWTWLWFLTPGVGLLIAVLLWLHLQHRMEKRQHECASKLMETLQGYQEAWHGEWRTTVHQLHGDLARIAQALEDDRTQRGSGARVEAGATRCPGASADPSVHIFVGNLALTTTAQDLRQLFEPYGTVATVRIMTDRETGRPRGFGFVEMPDGTAARAALAGLQGQELAGRALTVNEARPRADRRAPRRPHW